MKPEKIAWLRAWITVVERSTPEQLAEFNDVRRGFRTGAYVMQLAGVTGTGTIGWEAAKVSWLRAARKKIAQAEAECPGHVAAAHDCGIHIDELRTDDADPINLAGSGPLPIEPREG